MLETPQETRTEAVTILDRIKGATAPSAAMTLAEVLGAILRDCERRERRDATSEFYKSHLGAWARHFGEGRRLASLTVADVQDFIDERRKAGVGGLAIKHNLMALTRAMRLAGVEPNPAKSIKLIRPKGKKRDPSLRLAWAEVIDVLHKLKGDDYAVLAFIAGSGVRRTEFARMRWSDVDLVGDRIVVPVGKTEPRELPLPKIPSAWETCEQLLALNHAGKFLLPGADENNRVRFLQETVVRARTIAGQPKLQLHELRRAFATRVAERHPVPWSLRCSGTRCPGQRGSTSTPTGSR